MMIEKEVNEAIANKDKPTLIILANRLLDRIEKAFTVLFSNGKKKREDSKGEVMITTLKEASDALYNCKTVMGTASQISNLKGLLYGLYEFPIVSYETGFNDDYGLHTLKAGERLTTDDLEPFDFNLIPDTVLGYTLYYK